MAAFIGSRTEANLRQAFATATLASRRYTAIAEQADAEDGHHAALFRAIARSRANQAEAHLNKLQPCSDKTDTAYHSGVAIMDRLNADVDAYPAMARTARQEGFHEIADWFETLAKAERSHANRFQKALDTM